MSDNDHRKFVAKAERTAVSKQEIDVDAAQILNRLEVNMPTNQTDHANPGIASIWKDEQVRRSRQPKDSFPRLEIPLPEERLFIRPTESETFFRDVLVSKLNQINDSQMMDLSSTLDQTLLGRTVGNQTKDKFNLKQLLVNSVYPSECSQLSSGNILDASLILNHQSGRPSKKREVSQTIDSMHLNNTFVDEDIVNSLSQKQNRLRNDVSWADVSRKYSKAKREVSNICILLFNRIVNEAEFALLEVMQQLDANDKTSQLVDDDSLLAPLSQAQVERKQSQTLANVSQIGVHEEDSSNSDDDLLNDFSMCFDSSQFLLENDKSE